MKEIKKYKEIKNTTDYKLALFFTEANERMRILEILENKKCVYAKNSAHSVVPEGLDLGDEVIESESERNEVINDLIRQITPQPLLVK